MNRTKSILLMGAAVLCFVAGSSVPSRAQSGVAYVAPAKPPNKVPPAPSAEQKAQDLKIQALLDALQTNQTKLPAQVKKAMKDLTPENNNLMAFHLDNLDFNLDQVPGETPAAGSTTSIPSIPNSDANFLSDHLQRRTPLRVYATADGGGIDLNKTFCLPHDTGIVGMASTFTSATKQAADGATQQPASNYLPARLDTDGGLILPKQLAPLAAADQATAKSESPVCSAADVSSALAGDTTFYVDQNDLTDMNREGLDFGTLVVPFKFQLSDKTAVTSSATLGGYVGYRLPFDIAGLRLRPVAFVGLSEVPTSGTDSSGNTTSQTVAGISYGFGIIGTIKDSFNLGVIVGADHVDSVQNYQYQDKPWISLELGISLTGTSLTK